MSDYVRPDLTQVNPLGLVTFVKDQAARSATRNSQRLQRGQLSPWLADKDARYWQRLIELAQADAGMGTHHSNQKAA